MNNLQSLKEAILWAPAGDSKVQCFLCSHRCRIAPGKRGVCRVRENVEGVFYTYAYGNPIARNIDPIEKKPLYHFLPGTSSYSIATIGCNFQCGFCQNWQISQASIDALRSAPGNIVSPQQLVEDALRYDCASIAYTYTEPTIFFEYAYETATLAHKHGLKNVFVTNGYETAETIEKMAGTIDAANVDLKSFNDEFYRSLCKATLQPVLDSIAMMFNKGIHIEVTTLVVPGQNDSEDELKRIAEFLAGVSVDIPWHVSRFHPDFKMTNSTATPPSTILRAIEIGRQSGLRYVYAGNLPGTEHESTHCPYCQSVVVARRGYATGGIALEGDRCGACGKSLYIVNV